MSPARGCRLEPRSKAKRTLWRETDLERLSRKTVEFSGQENVGKLKEGTLRTGRMRAMRMEGRECTRGRARRGRRRSEASVPQRGERTISWAHDGRGHCRPQQRVWEQQQSGARKLRDFPRALCS